MDNVDSVLKKTATIPFGYPQNNHTLRSTYKVKYIYILVINNYKIYNTSK